MSDYQSLKQDAETDELEAILDEAELKAEQDCDPSLQSWDY